MKWAFYVIVFVYMLYRAVYGAKVKEISSLVIEPVNYGEYQTYLPPNSHKTISCKYNNKNQKVEWLDPSGQAIPMSTTKRISVQKHVGPVSRGDRMYSLLLTFTDTQVDDTGEYECRSGEMFGTANLCVIGASDFVDTLTEVTMDEGRSYTLSCQARGQPEPRLVWIRNGEEIVDDGNSTKYQVMTKYNSQGFEGLLTITSLTPEDSGVYTCKAIQEHTILEDCTLTKYMNISVVVNYAPVFEDGNETIIYGKNNQSIDLVCSAGAHPTPSYRWFHALDDDTVYEYPKDRINLSEDKTEAKFVLMANALTFGQKYICEATNEHGVAKKVFSLLKIEKPKKPSEINVINSTSSLVELNVTWTEPVHFPIEYFEVQYILEGTKKKIPREYDWRRAPSFNFEVEEALEDNSAVIKLTNLEPETNYWVRLRAANDLGNSVWSNPIIASTTPVEEQEEAVTTTETNAEESEEQAEAAEEDAETEADESSSSAMFYGIFFAGGIIVLTFVCVVVMRFV